MITTISARRRGVVFIFWGKPAQKKVRCALCIWSAGALIVPQRSGTHRAALLG